jgi:general secretion pathway protein B
VSFILDALRKSEHERQRTAMPGIAQVPFGLPRRQMPAWPIVVIVVLVIAVLALGAAWWRSTRQQSIAATDPPAPARTEIPLPLPPPTAIAMPPAPIFSAPPAAESAVEPAAAPNERPPATAATRSGDSASETTFARDDAVEAEPAAEDPTLPSAEALAAEGVAVPRLRLELHAYSARPSDRFVFINGTKYLEGATLAEGPRIVSIAPNGAVLQYLGHRFLLAPQ